MRHSEYSGVQRGRYFPPKHQRIDLNEPLAEVARMRAAMSAKVETQRQQAASRLRDSIQQVIMNMSSTRRLALNLRGKHASASATSKGARFI